MPGTPPFGVPGIETTLPLMLTAMAEGKLNQAQLIEKLSTTPSKVFGIKTDPGTKVEVEMGDFEIKNQNLLTKCGWSPFDGRKVAGRVKATYIRGTKVFEDGKVLVKPGSGQVVTG